MICHRINIVSSYLNYKLELKLTYTFAQIADHRLPTHYVVHKHWLFGNSCRIECICYPSIYGEGLSLQPTVHAVAAASPYL